MVSWLPEPGRGFTDLPGLELRRGEHQVTTALVLQHASAITDPTGAGWCFECVDELAGLTLSLTLTLDAASGVCSAGCVLSNTGREPLSVQALATVCLPMPETAVERYTIGGTWSAEFRAVREAIGSATWQQEARTGRSSHHAFPGITLLERGTDATRGQAWSAQIAWSGNTASAFSGFAWAAGSGSSVSCCCRVKWCCSRGQATWPAPCTCFTAAMACAP